jgi:predicted alpha/beta hydrolase
VKDLLPRALDFLRMFVEYLFSVSVLFFGKKVGYHVVKDWNRWMKNNDYYFF